MTKEFLGGSDDDDDGNDNEMKLVPRICSSTGRKGGRHVTYRYIDPSRHNFEKYLSTQFVSQSCLGQPLAAQLAR